MLLLLGRALIRRLRVQTCSYATGRLTGTEFAKSKFKTKLRSKLDDFVKRGQIDFKYTPTAPNNNKKRYIKPELSSQKVLMHLKAIYEHMPFIDESGRSISVQSIRLDDIKTDNPRSLTIFRNLRNLKKQNAKPIFKPILYTLLGVSEDQLKDEFVVTKSTLSLLMRDQCTERAEELARVAGKNGTVAMNSIMSWLLEKGDIDGAFKNYHNCKKWRIPKSHHTLTLFYDGIAKSQEWGKLSPRIGEKAVEIFNQENENYKTKLELMKKNKSTDDDDGETLRLETEQYNACLNLLVRCYDKSQLQAWQFFEKLNPVGGSKSNEYKIIPDCQTYTIMLNGCLKYSQSQANFIKNDKQMSVNDKTLKLLNIQAKLVNTAEIIVQQVVEKATPPPPPTKEEALNNPEVLYTYREKMRRLIISIDPNFAAVVASCYINDIGTGVDYHSGSHYLYVKKGFQYLCYWSNQVEELFKFISFGNENNIPDATAAIKLKTDYRILKAMAASEYIAEIRPEEIARKELTKEKTNPIVVFPPPIASKNKTKAIFSNTKKPLVDFARPTNAELRALVLDKQYKITDGKYGKKLPPKSEASTRRKPQSMNRFFLQLIISGLVSQGRHNEFMKLVWFILTKFGDIRINTGDIDLIGDKYYPLVETEKLTEFVDKKNFSNGILLKEDYPSVLEEIKNYKDSSLSSDFNEQIIDIKLIHTMFFKISQNNRRNGLSGINSIVEIFAALLNPKTNPGGFLEPDFKTIDIICSIFVDDLHYYNDYNYNNIVVEKQEKNLSNNSPKKSINHEQLNYYLPVLINFTDLLQINGKKRTPAKYQTLGKTYINNSEVESFNKIVDRLHKSTWIDVTEEQELQHHLRIIKAGILFFRPNELIDSREKVVYSTLIIKSMNYVFDRFKDDKKLSSDHLKIFKSIRNLTNIEGKNVNDLGQLEKIVRDVYNSIH